MSRIPRYLAFAAAVLSLGACAGSITEPSPECTTSATTKSAPNCASADLINPSV